MVQELVQIVDEKDQPVRGAPISQIRNLGLWHRVGRVMVEDGMGNILLQRRLPDKRLFPDRWDNSAAGVIKEGESYEVGTARELAEEIGVHDVNLTEIGYYKASNQYKDQKLNEWQKVYKVILPKDFHFTYQADEVAWAMWVTIGEAKKLVQEHPEQVTTGLAYVLQHYY